MHFSGWFCPIVVLFFILSSPQTVGTCANAHILGGSTDPKATMITDTNLTVLDTIPKLIVHTDPEYPQQAIRAEIEGTVACDLLVSEEGSVEQVTVTQSAHPLLDSCVTQAAANFHFSPGWIDGQKVAVVLSYEKTFSLQQVCSRIQPITNFSGTVIEEGSKIPVPAAELTIIYRDTTQENTLGLPFHRYLQALSAFGQQHCNGDTVTTYTDSLGRFSLYSLPNGAFTVTIMQPGFAILTTSDTITTNHELIATYKLHSLSPHDYEIIAYGINENSNKETLRRELSQMEMKKIAGLGGDAVKVVQALPGIARPYMGGGEIIIRGSETYDSNYYIDGIQIPLLFHYGYKSTYNSDAIKSVALYPGGFSARYGNALGGIIDITGRTAARKPSHQSDSTQGDHRPRVSIDANMTDCSIMAEADIGNGRSFIASTRRSFLGELMSFAAASVPEATIMTMAPYYWDYLLRFDNTFSPRSSAFFTLFGVNDELRLQATPSSLTSRANSSINLKNTFYMGILGWDYRLSSKGHLIMKIAGASGLNHFSGIDNLNNTVDYQSATVVSELTYRLNPITTMVLGCDIEATPSTISLQYRDKSGLKYLSQTKKQMLGDCGTFLMWQLHPRNNFNGKIGLRYDYYPQVDYFGPWLPQLADHPFFKNSTRFSGEPSLRLDATYTFRPNHVFTFAFGNYTQAPLRIEKPVYHQLDNVITTVSRANHVVGGYTWRASDMLSLELALYRNSQWNLSRPAFSDALITQGYNYVYDGRKKITGMELLLRRSRSRGFFGWISYTLSQSLEYNFDVNRFIPSEKDQTHNLTLTGTWFLPMQCDVGAKVQFSTGAPETPLVGYIYNEQTHTNQLLFGRPNSSRMPPSLTLDVRFDKKFTVKSCKYSAYIDFQNVGSLLYQSPQANPINEISVEKPINPQTHKQNKRYLYLLSIPSLGIRGEF